jgi:hypothetical protein
MNKYNYMINNIDFLKKLIAFEMNTMVVQEWFLAKKKHEYWLLIQSPSHYIKVQPPQVQKYLILKAVSLIQNSTMWKIIHFSHMTLVGTKDYIMGFHYV